MIQLPKSVAWRVRRRSVRIAQAFEFASLIIDKDFTLRMVADQYSIDPQTVYTDLLLLKQVARERFMEVQHIFDERRGRVTSRG